MTRRVFMTAALLLAALPAGAHDAPMGWRYEAFCCNGDNHTGDCQMIPHTAVRAVPGGYELTLRPGDHRLVTRDHVFRFPQTTTRRSQDGDFHLCLFPDENTPRCFYAPDMSF